ncbi:MAG: bifunctional nicotinamidase/pyrazinamidase [Acidobacteriota bacterium]
MMEALTDAAFLIVDLQNDFCPGGALGVNRGDEIIPVINQLQKIFPLVVATQDWHPAGHISFQEQGGPWPPHCMQNTFGAAFHSELNQQRIRNIFRKASAKEKDAYSSFEGIDSQERSLNEYLKANGARKIYIAGLATDYCVKATALDGLKLGYEVYVFTDAVRAVEVQPGDSEKAFNEMIAAGAKIIDSRAILNLRRKAQIAGE